VLASSRAARNPSQELGEAGAAVCLCRPSLHPPETCGVPVAAQPQDVKAPWPGRLAASLSRADQVIEDMWGVVSRHFLLVKNSLIFWPLNLAPSTIVWPTPVNISLNPGPT
jgi:hypothetical protein